jgi:hypothetical protein
MNLTSLTIDSYVQLKKFNDLSSVMIFYSEIIKEKELCHWVQTYQVWNFQFQKKTHPILSNKASIDFNKLNKIEI